MRGRRGGLVHMGSGQGMRLPKPHRNNIRFTEEGAIKSPDYTLHSHEVRTHEI